MRYRSDSVFCDATFSDDRVHRYSLMRAWGGGADANGEGMLVVIGLNPSTATETEDDPTIRRCMGFARRDGFGGLTMLNLFGYRSTDPLGLLGAPDPNGPGNDDAIAGICGAHPATVVAAWGSHKRLGALLTNRARHVRAMLADVGVRLHCFGVNADGQPKHPLYLSGATPVRALEAA